jgi:ribose/xylose/arabinose/galactoside ABC-type transport system permease subunit/ABC-type branched-subunit amino acid transport system ATPase component
LTVDTAPRAPRTGRLFAGAYAPGEHVSRRGLALLAVVLTLALGLRFDTFLTVDNGLSIALNISSLLIAACGATWLLVAGQVDLSIGSMYSLLAMTVALVARDTQSAVAAVAAGLLVGLLFGGVNGLLVRLLPVNPLIVTLGMLLVYGGLAYAITGGVAVYDLPATFVTVGRARLLGVPAPVLIAAAVFGIATFLLSRSVPGLRTYAVGGNDDAARRHGVNVERHIVALYAFNGCLIGLVALLTTARLGSGTPSLGTGFELDVLTAVILGGIAFTGGGGRALGVLAGIALIGVLNAGLIFVGARTEYQQIAKGGVLLLALFADQYGAETARRLRRLLGRRPAPPAGTAPVGTAPVGTAPVGRDPAESDGVPLSRGALSRRQDTPGRAEELLACQDVEVSFGAVRALSGVDFAVHRGEVVCLVGDNGAGKSTLIKVLSGALTPSAGTVEVAGERAEFASPAAARAAGIQTVYQDLAVFPNLGVAHNLVLGAEPRHRWLGLVPLRDDATAERLAAQRLRELGIELPNYRTPVRYLSGGQRQAVAIAGALTGDRRVLILDEPTAALGVAQTRTVLRLARSVADMGAGVVLISHDVETVFAVADRIVVLRLGRVVFDGPAALLSETELVGLMAGLATEHRMAR